MVSETDANGKLEPHKRRPTVLRVQRLERQSLMHIGYSIDQISGPAVKLPNGEPNLSVNQHYNVGGKVVGIVGRIYSTEKKPREILTTVTCSTVEEAEERLEYWINRLTNGERTIKP